MRLEFLGPQLQFRAVQHGDPRSVVATVGDPGEHLVDDLRRRGLRRTVGLRELRDGLRHSSIVDNRCISDGTAVLTLDYTLSSALRWPPRVGTADNAARRGRTAPREPRRGRWSPGPSAAPRAGGCPPPGRRATPPAAG